MEYERIHRVQAGVISPSKLRLKLLGPHHNRGKEGGGSKSNSSRTSPSKIEDAEYARSSLLSDPDGDFHEEGFSKDASAVSFPDVRSLEASGAMVAIDKIPNPNQAQNGIVSKQNGEPDFCKMESVHKGLSHHVHFSANLRHVHPMRSQDEDGADYDSGHDNASSSSFEFHKGERTLHNPILRPFLRTTPSKWNDAERWIINPNASKKSFLQNHANRQTVANLMRVVPETVISEQKVSAPPLIDTKQVDSCNLSSLIGGENFSFTGPLAGLGPVKGLNELSDRSLTGDDLSIITGEVGENEHVDTTTSAVSMRDTGTEMTPMTSLEPSRSATPIGSMTPVRSPISSLPSTPRGELATFPAVNAAEEKLGCPEENMKTELSDKELQQKTRREIVALGMRLGKMNIAAWASKEEEDTADTTMEDFDAEKLKKIEFAARAAAWEEAEKSKHNARFKREEIKIEAWESHQRSKIEVEMRRIEAQAEQMRALAQDKMINKLKIARQRAEEMRAAAEARKNRQSAKTTQQVEYIHRTGRMPLSHFLCFCCSP